jgi:hypothetical protein
MDCAILVWCPFLLRPEQRHAPEGLSTRAEKIKVPVIETKKRVLREEHPDVLNITKKFI